MYSFQLYEVQWVYSTQFSNLGQHDVFWEAWAPELTHHTKPTQYNLTKIMPSTMSSKSQKSLQIFGGHMIKRPNVANIFFKVWTWSVPKAFKPFWNDQNRSTHFRKHAKISGGGPSFLPSRLPQTFFLQRLDLVPGCETITRLVPVN